MKIRKILQTICVVARQIVLRMQFLGIASRIAPCEQDSQTEGERELRD